MKHLLLVFVGGGAGSVLRYLVWRVCAAIGGTPQPDQPSFPIATLVVNAVGCAAIGALAAIQAGPDPLREEWRLLLMVGVLGGFTTFSAFGHETVALFRAGATGLAVLNIAAQNFLGLLAAWLAFRAIAPAAGAAGVAP